MTEGSERRSPGIEAAIRAYGPVVVLAALTAWAYHDLKTDIRDLRGKQAERAAAVRDAIEKPASAPDARPEKEASLEPAAPVATTPSVDWGCTGSIPEEKVLETVGKSGRIVFDCYEAAASLTPGLAGKLVLELNVGADGKVREARVKGSIQDPAMLACITDSVYGWTFTPPDRGVCAVVSVPFALGASGKAPAGTPAGH